MDERRKKEIDHAWRKARRTQFVEHLRRTNKGVLALGALGITAILFLVAFPAFAPPHLVKTVQAYGLSEASYPSTYFPGRRDALARLDNGALVTFVFPRSSVFRPGVPMRLDLYERGWGPIHYRWYRFNGYVETAPQATGGPPAMLLP